MKFKAGPIGGDGKPYYVTSECGAYTISRSTDEMGDRFSAWLGRTPLGEATRDREEAARLCREHRASITGEREFGKQAVQR